jgi:hypothetical protein
MIAIDVSALKELDSKNADTAIETARKLARIVDATGLPFDGSIRARVVSYCPVRVEYELSINWEGCAVGATIFHDHLAVLGTDLVPYVVRITENSCHALLRAVMLSRRQPPPEAPSDG